MKICIIGGGNLGTLLTAELTAKGIETTIISSKPEKWAETLSVYDQFDSLLWKAKGFHVTDQWSAVADADQIWITYPSFLLPKLSQQLLPYTRKGQLLLCIPGCGAEYSFAPHISKGCILCGLQRVHCIVRLKEYGKSVYALGRKSEVFLGTIPAAQSAHCAEILGYLLNMPCIALDNYLAVTLTPSNPILHTSRLYSMFRDYRPGVLYDHNILFYEEWTDEASALLLECDSELQAICAALPKLELSTVKSLRAHYESDTVDQMTKKIRSIAAFRGLRSPMIQKENGWAPDFDSRYFTADFPFGLKIIKDIGRVAAVQTPHMDEIWDWYWKLCRRPEDPYFTLTEESPDALYAIYR